MLNRGGYSRHTVCVIFVRYILVMRSKKLKVQSAVARDSVAGLMQPLSPLDRKWWLAWLSISGVGWKTFAQLLAFCSVRKISLEEVYFSGLLQDELGLNQPIKEVLNSKNKNDSAIFIEDGLRNKKLWLVFFGDALYPKLLYNIPQPPWLLFGSGEYFQQPELPVAVVGTRRMSGYGQMVTRQLVTELVGQHSSIISGAMYGVDWCSHEAALAAQGSTIGILGYGHDFLGQGFYKRRFEAAQAAGMVFLSEYSPDTQPSKGTFPQRNRIVAGISEAVLVTEAGLKSGSHITALAGLEYGRVVGAVPGPITHPYTEGTKWLVNQGATLVSTASDILDEIFLSKPELRSKVLSAVKNSSTAATGATGMSILQTSILNLLDQQPLSVDDLSLQLAHNPAEVVAQLSFLELTGQAIFTGAAWMRA